ncbi:MAG: hypothetical protein Q8P16_01960 [bacterium]|nr:hypothetical protein [bacterium]
MQKVALVLFLAVLLSGTPLVSRATTADEMRREVASLLAEIHMIRAQLADSGAVNEPSPVSSAAGLPTAQNSPKPSSNTASVFSAFITLIRSLFALP